MEPSALLQYKESTDQWEPKIHLLQKNLINLSDYKLTYNVPSAYYFSTLSLAFLVSSVCVLLISCLKKICELMCHFPVLSQNMHLAVQR